MRTIQALPVWSPAPPAAWLTRLARRPGTRRENPAAGYRDLALAALRSVRIFHLVLLFQM
jgi:hypothetical protein